jgi:hypothetical protein
MDPINFNYIGNVYPQSFYYSKYEEFPLSGLKNESVNKEQSSHNKDNKNEGSD